MVYEMNNTYIYLKYATMGLKVLSNVYYCSSTDVYLFKTKQQKKEEKNFNEFYLGFWSNTNSRAFKSPQKKNYCIIFTTMPYNKNITLRFKKRSNRSGKKGTLFKIFRESSHLFMVTNSTCSRKKYRIFVFVSNKILLLWVGVCVCVCKVRMSISS